MRSATPSEFVYLARRALRTSTTSMPRAFAKFPALIRLTWLGQHLPQDAFQYRVLHQVRVQVREAAIIADGNFRNRFLGELRDESAQLFAQLDVRLEFLDIPRAKPTAC